MFGMSHLVRVLSGVGRTCGHPGSVTGQSSPQSAQPGVSTAVPAGTAVALAVGGGLTSDGLHLGKGLQLLLCVTRLCSTVSHVSLRPRGAGLGPGGKINVKGL